MVRLRVHQPQSRRKMISHSNKLHGPSRNFNLKVEVETLEGLVSIAKARGVSVSQVIRDALRKHLNKEATSVPSRDTRKTKAWWN